MKPLVRRFAVRLSRFEGAILALAVAAPAGAFLLAPGFLISSDGYYHLFRLVAFDAALRTGQFPVRWAQELYLGYGYPLFNYYAPLAYWLGEIAHLAGFSFVAAFKGVAIAALFMGSLGSYLLAGRLMAPLPAAVTSALYVYAPYALTDLYYRADLPEYLALGVIPWTFWAVAKALDGWVSVVPASLPLAALLLSHNGLAFAASPFIAGYGVWYAISETPKRRAVVALSRLVRGAAAGAAAMALSASFWLPAIAERHLVQFDRLLLIDYREQFVGLATLLATDLVHRYTAVAVGIWHVFPYRIALFQSIAAVAGIGAALALARQSPKLGLGVRNGMGGDATFAIGAWREPLTFAVLGGLVLLLSQEVTRPIWDAVPLLGHLQFPWRLIGLVALPAALLGGFAVGCIRSKPLRRLVAVGAIAACVVSALGGLRPVYSDLGNQVATPAGNRWFEALYNTIGTTTRGEFLPISVREPAAVSAAVLAEYPGMEAIERSVPDVRVDRSGAMENAVARWSDGSLVVEADFSDSAAIILPIAAFPGWRVQIDGRETDWGASSPDGLLSLRATGGHHRIVARYGQTAMQRLANLASLASVAAVLVALGLESWGVARRWLFVHRVAALRWNPVRTLGSAAVLLAGGLLAMAAARIPQPDGGAPAGEVVGELGGGALRFAASANAGTGLDSHVRVISPGEQIPVVLDLASSSGAASGPLTGMAARVTNAAGETWSRMVDVRDELLDSGTRRIAASIEVEADTPPGFYRVEVTPTGSPTSQEVEVTRYNRAGLIPIQNRIQLGPFLVVPGPISPTPNNELAAFVGGIRLVEATVSAGQGLTPISSTSASEPTIDVPAGADLRFRSVWWAPSPSTEDLRMSLHLVSPDGFLWAVRDSQPSHGLAPTSLWPPERLIGDVLRIPIPSETPPGDYRLELRLLTPNGTMLSTLDRTSAPTLPQVPLGIVRVLPRADLDPIAARLAHNLGGGLGFLRSSADARVRPGDRIEVDARFVGLPGATDQEVELAVEGASGTLVQSSVAPAGPAYPVGRWRPGEVVRGRHWLRLPVSTPAGSYRVVLTSNAGTRVTLGSVEVEAAPPRREASAPSRRIEARFGDLATLVGADLPNQVAPGTPIPIRLVWRADRDGTEALAVSVQMLDQTGKLVAQHDSAPAAGAIPTNRWRQGDEIDDRHPVGLPAGLPAGGYRAIVVLYDPASGRRLSTPNGDFVPLGNVEIRP